MISIFKKNRLLIHEGNEIEVSRAILFLWRDLQKYVAIQPSLSHKVNIRQGYDLKCELPIHFCFY